MRLGPSDQDGRNTDRGWLTLEDISTSKITCRGIDYVLTTSSEGARGIGDRAVENDGDTCQDRGGGAMNTFSPGGLVI
jgi:hypothetical protein